MSVSTSFEMIGSTSPFAPPRRIPEVVPRVGEKLTFDGEGWYTVIEVRWQPGSPFGAVREGYGVPLEAHVVLRYGRADDL